MEVRGWRRIQYTTCGLLVLVHLLDAFLVEFPVIPLILAGLFGGCGAWVRSRPQSGAIALGILCGLRALLAGVFLLVGPTEGLPWFELVFAGMIGLISAAGLIVTLVAASVQRQNTRPIPA